MRVVGADLSLTATGIAGPVGWNLRTVVPKKGMSDPDRMIFVRRCVMTAAGYFRRPIAPGGRPPVAAQLVVIEGFSFASRGRGVFQLGGLGWVVRAELHEYMIPWVEISPTALKQYATGKGNADKYAMRRAFEKRFGIETKDDNEADAGWLRAAGLDAYGELHEKYGVKMPEGQRAVLGRIEWPELMTLSTQGYPTGNVRYPVLGKWSR